jgi:hypothetical protein
MVDMVILDARGFVDDICSPNCQASLAFGTLALSDRWSKGLAFFLKLVLAGRQ